MDQMWRWTSYAAAAVPLAVALMIGYRSGGDTQEYIDAGRAISRGDFGTIRLPIGLPLLFAGANSVGIPYWLLTIASGMAFLFLIWWCSVRLAGPVAGVVAAGLCLYSPLVRHAAEPIMSDGTAAMLVMLAVACALADRWRAAGVFLGLSAWVRISHAAFALASPRRSMALAVFVTVLPLLVFNFAIYGSVTGYGEAARDFFRIDYLFGETLFESHDNPSTYPNIYLWPSILMGRFGLLAPLLPLFALTECWIRRREAATRLALGIILMNLVLHLFYYFQSPRFMLISAGLLIVYSAALAGRISAATLRKVRQSTDNINEPTLKDMSTS